MLHFRIFTVQLARCFLEQDTRIGFETQYFNLFPAHVSNINKVLILIFRFKIICKLEHEKGL